MRANGPEDSMAEKDRNMGIESGLRNKRVVVLGGSSGIGLAFKGWVIAASVCGTIEALTRALAVELAPLRVNAVSPGVVKTNLWQNMTEREREGMYESIGKKLLVGRAGEASDIARAYLYLMQEGYSTGQIVVVDGGGILV
jgi:NAD(P)-dependent dehydrogenase (short-subunit alcohol dehydrogenase family)